jgi:hypothetical protein
VPTGAADLSPKAGKGGGAKSATERAGKAVTPGIPKLAPR